jgi:hypothetical protein
VRVAPDLHVSESRCGVASDLSITRCGFVGTRRRERCLLRLPIPIAEKHSDDTGKEPEYHDIPEHNDTPEHHDDQHVAR